MSSGSDEWSVDYILSKTRERRTALDAELVRQASLSPCLSKRSSQSDRRSHDKENAGGEGASLPGAGYGMPRRRVVAAAQEEGGTLSVGDAR